MNINKKGIIQVSDFSQYLLPPEYVKLKYIESTGTQYIDTGVIGKSGNSAHMECQLTEIPNDGCLLGSRTGNNRIYLFYIFPSKWNIGYGANYNINSPSPVTNTYYSLDCQLNINSQKLVVNNETIITQTIADEISANTNLYLFCNNYGNASYFIKMKLYTLKIWNDNNLVRDFIPCYRKSDNEIGLYDLVTKQFFTNQGTGEFTVGPNINNVYNKVRIYNENDLLKANNFIEI